MLDRGVDEPQKRWMFLRVKAFHLVDLVTILEAAVKSLELYEAQHERFGTYKRIDLNLRKGLTLC
jgi:hypothetical protein